MECVTAVCFVKHEAQLLDCPCWIMIINLVAMDMLKTRIPPVRSASSKMLPNGDKMMIPNGVPLPAPIPTMMNGGGHEGGRTKPMSRGEDEDDPYSLVTGLRARGDRPPKLPPRDLNIPKVSDSPVPLFCTVGLFNADSQLTQYEIFNPIGVYSLESIYHVTFMVKCISLWFLNWYWLASAKHKGNNNHNK